MDCEAGAVEEGIPIQAEPQRAARTSGPGAEEIQNVHIRERMLLARTSCGHGGDGEFGVL